MAQEAAVEQRASAQEAFSDTAQEFLELADKNGSIGNYTKLYEVGNILRDANTKASDGRVIEAYTDIASAAIGPYIIEKIITNPKITTGAAKFCASNVVIGAGCLLTTAVVAFNTSDVIRQKLAKVAQIVQAGYPASDNKAVENISSSQPPAAAQKILNGRNAPGKWLFVNDGAEAKLGWIPADNYPSFSGIWLACALDKKIVSSISINLTLESAKPGRNTNIKIAKGNANINISGVSQEGEDDVYLGASLEAGKVREFLSQEGDIVIYDTKKPWVYGAKSLQGPLKQFSQKCGSAAAPFRSETSGCLSYQGRTVITGVIELKTYPGPPNYTSVASGDRPETVLVLKTDKAECVDKDNSDVYGMSPALSKIKEVQLSATASQLGANMVGRRVEVSGRISVASTGHQHTPIVMDDVKAVPR